MVILSLKTHCWQAPLVCVAFWIRVGIHQRGYFTVSHTNKGKVLFHLSIVCACWWNYDIRCILELMYGMSGAKSVASSSHKVLIAWSTAPARNLSTWMVHCNAPSPITRLPQNQYRSFSEGSWTTVPAASWIKSRCSDRIKSPPGSWSNTWRAPPSTPAKRSLQALPCRFVFDVLFRATRQSQLPSSSLMLLDWINRKALISSAA